MALDDVPKRIELPDDIREMMTEEISDRAIEGTILVIDDSEVVREALSDMLSNYKLTVLLAEDGASGVKLFKEKQHEIEVVILDFSMPGMNGEETFRELQKLDPEVRVILSSGYSREEATEHFEEPGLMRFLQKPYTVEALLSEIRRCLDR